MKKIFAAVAFAAAVSAGASAGATEFVQNGDFTSLTAGLGQIDSFTVATGWVSDNPNHDAYNFVMANGTAGSNGQYGNVSLWTQANGGSNTWDGLSSLGGNFVAMDSDFQNGALTQTITGLQIGKTYNLSFEYAFGQQAGFDGPVLQSLAASVNTLSWNSGNYLVGSHTFVDWQTGGGSFVANATSATLSFIATGSIQLPPFALVSNVSLTGGVPEPSTWAMMLIGFGGLGAAARFRARRAVKA